MKLPKQRRQVVVVEAPRRTRRMGGGRGGGSLVRRSLCPPLPPLKDPPVMDISSNRFLLPFCRPE